MRLFSPQIGRFGRLTADPRFAGVLYRNEGAEAHAAEIKIRADRRSERFSNPSGGAWKTPLATALTEVGASKPGR